MGSIPGGGTKIPHAVQRGRKKKENENGLFHSVEVLSGVPEHKVSVMCFMKKIFLG